MILLGFVALLAAGSTMASVAPSAQPKADTVIRMNNKIVIIKDDTNKQMDVEVQVVDRHGKRQKARRVFKGVYDTNHREEQFFSSIRIPFVPTGKKAKKNNGWTTDTGFLGFGVSALMLDGPDTKHINNSGSRRFMLPLLSVNRSNYLWGYSFRTSFDFNNIRLLDSYTFRRDAEGQTHLVAPEVGQQFGKNNLHITYFNVEGRMHIKPISGLRSLSMFALSRVKIKTASSMKSWPTNGAMMRFDGNQTLSPIVWEVGAGVGYGSLSLIGTYTLTPIFQHGLGPELRMVTIGLGFGL